MLLAFSESILICPFCTRKDRLCFSCSCSDWWDWNDWVELALLRAFAVLLFEVFVLFMLFALFLLFVVFILLMLFVELVFIVLLFSHFSFKASLSSMRAVLKARFATLLNPQDLHTIPFGFAISTLALSPATSSIPSKYDGFAEVTWFRIREALKSFRCGFELINPAR